ncbi:MAG: ATP-grasp domain-containing protein [Chloroflexota bacterium]|nr:MAG: ATP-grasp domain-containing protein [Chloroflexota bacterium]
MKIGIVYNSFSYKRLNPEEKEMRDTGLTVGKQLKAQGHDVQFFDMDNPADIEKLCRSKIDVAFDVCERIQDDARGEAYIAALLEFLGIPHTRTRSPSISFGIDKLRVKAILAYHDIPTPRYQVFRSERDQLRKDMGFPLFVKGSASENSIGIDEHSYVENLDQLIYKVKQIRLRLKQPALVEEYIDGRELNVAILPGKKPCVLPISEIVFKDLAPNRRYMDYRAKWNGNSDRFKKTVPRCPAQLSRQEQRIVEETALKSYRVLGLDSYVRVDIRFKDQIPYILEVNQNPSIGEKGCGYVRSCNGYGLDYTGMLNAILQNALMRQK